MVAWEVSTLRHVSLKDTRRNKGGKTHHDGGIVDEDGGDEARRGMCGGLHHRYDTKR